MGNKKIPKTKIFGDRLLKAISEAGYSIRGLAKEIGNVSDRTIRTYLKRNEMPEYILQKIDDVIRPKGRFLLMTVDVLVPITNDEMQYFLKVYGEEISEKASCRGVGVTDVALKELMKRDIQVMDGYVPEYALENYKKYFGMDLVKKNEEGSK